MNTTTDRSVFKNQAESLSARTRFLPGLAVFFVVTGLQLLGSPFLYSLDYGYSIIAIVILAFGSSISFILSLYFTERLIVEDKIKVWKIAIKSLICSLLFGFLYLVSLYFYLQTIGSSEGYETVIGFIIGIVFTIISLFVFFISNLFFYKAYKKINNKFYYLLFIGSFIFFLVMIGLKIGDYYDCNFSKDADCVTEKALSAKDATLCEKNKYANPHDRNECRISVSKNSTDVDICRKIEGGAGRDPEDFKYQCFSNIALNTKNYSLCEELKKQGYKNDCYISIAKETNNIGICDKVFGDQGQFSECVENIAIGAKNSALCNKVTDDKNRKYCYLGFDLNVSKTSNNTAVCDKIRRDGWGSDQVESCFANVAAYTGDYSLCEKVKDYSNYRDSCYLRVSRNSTDISSCDKIGYHDNDYNYECVTNIAINTGNRSLCENVPAKPTDFKERCYSDFDKKIKH